MANQDIHEKQAKHNYGILKLLLSKPNTHDWQITLAFYTALHIVECHLTKKNPKWREGRMQISTEKDNTIHAWRGKCANQAFGSNFYTNYRMLEERSKLARYLEGTAGDKISIDVIRKEDAKNCIEEHLKKIIDEFHYKW